MADIFEHLGQRIKQQRVIMRMTQESLAEKVGISQSFLGHIEHGTRKMSVDTLVKLCNILQTSPSILLQDSLEDLSRMNDQDMDPQKMNLLRELSEKIMEYWKD